jgi:hypothetical protein
MGSNDVSVNRDTLIPQAKVWDAQASAMGTIASQAGSMNFSDSASITAAAAASGTAGGVTGDAAANIFAGVIDAYNAVSKEIATWCGQGDQEMQAIAQQLVKADQGYDTTENVNSQSAYNAVG